MLRRRHQQQRLGAARGLAELERGGNAGIERHAGQEERVDVVAVDRRHHLGLARPQHHLAPGAARGERQGAAPGAAADDADALKGVVSHQLSVISSASAY